MLQTLWLHFCLLILCFFSCDSLIAWEICTGVVAPLVAGKTLLATLCRCADTCAIVNMCRCADCGPYCEQVQMCNCAIFCIVRLIIIASGNLLLTFEAGSSGWVKTRRCWVTSPGGRPLVGEEGKLILWQHPPAEGGGNFSSFFSQQFSILIVNFLNVVKNSINFFHPRGHAFYVRFCKGGRDVFF